MLVLFLQHSSEFHKRLFESAVSSIRTIAANHLWQVLDGLMNFVFYYSLRSKISVGNLVQTLY